MDQLVFHAVSRQFPVHMRLEPVHPSAAHLVWVALDIRGPGSPSDSIASFEEQSTQSYDIYQYIGARTLTMAVD